MTNPPTSETRDPISMGIDAGIENAIADAERRHAPLIIWRDGNIVEISPAELRKIRNEHPVNLNP